jgi:plastocyanin domain-containing protein
MEARTSRDYSMDTWLAILLVALLPGAMLGFFVVDWLRSREAQGRARPNAAGVQELEVRVAGGYHPATVVVKAGSPVRLNFIRAEDTPCSGRVIFGGLGLERRLPAFATTAIEFVPEAPGEYLFTCELGMYQGWLRVEPAARQRARRAASRGSDPNGSPTTQAARAIVPPSTGSVDE